MFGRRAWIAFGLALGLAAHLPALPPAAATTGTKPVDHIKWTALLRAYVKPGRDGINRVDYTGLKASGGAQLKAYIASLESAAPSKMSAPARKAFWINLYNAKTLDIVLARYPVGSIRDIALPEPDGKLGDGPWKANVVTVEGKAFSLDDIEKLKLVPEFKDVRIHYALNCLSIGCPNLLPEAFVASRIDRQLDGAARAFVNHPRGITIKPGRVEASNIYEWYAEEFGGFKGVVAHLTRYAKPELRRQLATLKKIDAYDYDWQLNDAAKQ